MERLFGKGNHIIVTLTGFDTPLIDCGIDNVELIETNAK